MLITCKQDIFVLGDSSQAHINLNLSTLSDSPISSTTSLQFASWCASLLDYGLFWGRRDGARSLERVFPFFQLAFS